MRCPYCGSKDTVLSSDKCFACGKVLLKQEECTQPPFVRYEVPQGYLQLGEHSVRLSAKQLMAQMIDVELEYRDLYDVSYMPGSRWEKGFLCLRGRKYKHIGLSFSSNDIMWGEKRISFKKEHNEAFYRAFLYLKGIAETNPRKPLPPDLQQFKPQQTMLRVPEGYLSLEDDRVYLSVKPPRIPRIDIVIAYKELYDVSFLPGTVWIKGFLCLRDKEHRNKPLPLRYGDRILGDTLISFEQEHNKEFHNAFLFLKKIAEENSKNQ